MKRHAKIQRQAATIVPFSLRRAKPALADLKSATLKAVVPGFGVHAVRPEQTRKTLCFPEPFQAKNHFVYTLGVQNLSFEPSLVAKIRILARLRAERKGVLKEQRQAVPILPFSLRRAKPLY